MLFSLALRISKTPSHSFLSKPLTLISWSDRIALKAMSSRRSSRLSVRSRTATDAAGQNDKQVQSTNTAPEVAVPPPKSTKGRKRKVSQETQVSAPSGDGPSTPKRRGKAPLTAKLPPITPTPSAVGVISEASTVTPKKVKKARRADPHATNAPLQTPGGTRVVKSFPVDNLTPGIFDRENIVTTENLLEKACAHLCAIDPGLKPLVAKHTCKLFTAEGLAEEIDPFVALSSSIISQQVRSMRLVNVTDCLISAIGIWRRSRVDKEKIYRAISSSKGWTV
jgi:DNA-3-methyladenine glycosylase II